MRHPGPLETIDSKRAIADDLLLNKFEKVSFRDSEQSERWLLRKSPNNKIKAKDLASDDLPQNEYLADCSFDVKHESVTPRNKASQRASDANLSRLTGKRSSVEDEHKLKCSKCQHLCDLASYCIF